MEIINLHRHYITWDEINIKVIGTGRDARVRALRAVDVMDRSSRQSHTPVVLYVNAIARFELCHC
jgi:hypothetical protein